MEEQFLVCPYNNSHKIIRHRMPGHLIKCKKNYTGPPLEQCLYNATHLIKQGEMAAHLEECVDCYHFNNTALLQESEKFRNRNTC